MTLTDIIETAGNRIKLQIKRFRNDPDSFYFIGKNNHGEYTLPEDFSEVTEVGEELPVVHLLFHDMMPYAVRCKLTDEKYLRGLDANAVYVNEDKFERLGPGQGCTYVQPLLIG